jgi:hypothetical protein
MNALFSFATVGLLSFSASVANANQSSNMTMQDVLDTQQAWGAGIVHIGQVKTSGGDYVQAATDHIRKMYDYEEGAVMFKPTLAAVAPFRPTFEGALSYFVGAPHNASFPEDTGFAIRPWTNVRFDNHQLVLYGTKAIVMGHYYFTTVEGNEVKVEYTLGFKKRPSGVKIFLQDSSLPFGS